MPLAEYDEIVQAIPSDRAYSRSAYPFCQGVPGAACLLIVKVSTPSIAEMADKERINRSYLSRTIRLSLLAPDIVEAILNVTQPAMLQLSDLERPFPIDWEQQRAAFGFSEPCVAIMKHANPCGIAVGADLAEAHRKAHACDPVSAFGGVIAANGTSLW